MEGKSRTPRKTESDYIVLAETDDETWKVLGTVTLKAGSRSSSAARAGLAQYQPEGGKVVAIPADEWTPEDLRPKLTFA
jgi:hypothetical protein